MQRQPGFVCRVEGQPASDPCVSTPPADAYWGLFWSDGRSGAWSYATTSASGLNVPDGGYVGFSWNSSAARSAPGVAPTAHPAAPTKTPSAKPTSKPSTKPSTKPSSKASTKPSTKPTPTPTPTASASVDPTTQPDSPARRVRSATTQAPDSVGQPTKSPGGVDGEMLPESPAPTDSSSTEAAADPSGPSDDGLPTWVGPVVIVGLFAAGGAVAVVRRRRNSSP